jgi:uncharacterized membrane protein
MRLLNFWHRFRSNFWFLPGLMCTFAALLAFASVAIDEHAGLEDDTFLYAGTPEGARQLLGAIASSSITVAGVVFSITMVALSQAASQYGPRLLRNFIRDTGNQVVLGTFLATFVYSLLVLRTVRSGDEQEFVPQVSTTIAVLLAGASIGVLIYFVHHIAASMQVNYQIRHASAELGRTIKRVFPEPEGEEATTGEPLPEDFERGARAIVASGSGYIQSIAFGSLLSMATEENLVISLAHQPGQFVVRDSIIAHVQPRASVTDDTCVRVNRAMTLGMDRTPTQDVDYAIDQLVEIAIRALSPGVNDSFTAITCVDYLADGLMRLLSVSFPSGRHYDDAERLRLVVPAVGFEQLARAAFDQIRQSARDNPAVTIRLLEAIRVLMQGASNAEHRRVLIAEAAVIERGARDLPEERDRLDVHAAYARVLDAANNPAG